MSEIPFTQKNSEDPKPAITLSLLESKSESHKHEYSATIAREVQEKDVRFFMNKIINSILQQHNQNSSTSIIQFPEALNQILPALDNGTKLKITTNSDGSSVSITISRHMDSAVVTLFTGSFDFETKKLSIGTE